jgi:hypothetical protein
VHSFDEVADFFDGYPRPLIGNKNFKLFNIVRLFVSAAKALLNALPYIFDRVKVGARCGPSHDLNTPITKLCLRVTSTMRTCIILLEK